MRWITALQGASREAGAREAIPALPAEEFAAPVPVACPVPITEVRHADAFPEAGAS